MKKTYQLQAASSGFGLGGKTVKEQIQWLENNFPDEKTFEVDSGKITYYQDHWILGSPGHYEVLDQDASPKALLILSEIIKQAQAHKEANPDDDPFAMVPDGKVEYKKTPEHDMFPTDDDEQGGGKIDDDDDFAMVPD